MCARVLYANYSDAYIICMLFVYTKVKKYLLIARPVLIDRDKKKKTHAA